MRNELFYLLSHSYCKHTRMHAHTETATLSESAITFLCRNLSLNKYKGLKKKDSF